MDESRKREIEVECQAPIQESKEPDPIEILEGLEPHIPYMNLSKLDVKYYTKARLIIQAHKSGLTDRDDAIDELRSLGLWRARARAWLRVKRMATVLVTFVIIFVVGFSLGLTVNGGC